MQKVKGGKIMELKDFVRDTITQIVEGASEAHKTIQRFGAAVNPQGMITEKGVASREYGQVQYVEFDVALMDSDRTSAGGGIGVLLGTLNLGGRAQQETEAQSHTRIKFRIPIGFREEKEK